MKQKPTIQELEDILEGKEHANKIEILPNGEVKIEKVTSKEYELLLRIKRAAKQVVDHWNEFGPEYGHEEYVTGLENTIKNYNEKYTPSQNEMNGATVPQQPLCADGAIAQMPPCHECTHLKCTLVITEQLGSMCSINDNWRHFTKR